MAERIHELLLRNLQEVFGEGDPTKRRSAIQELYTDDCVLYVPPGTFVGHDALDKFAGDLRATHPHFAYAPHAAPQALHNSGRLKWGSGPRGGVPAYTGEDVIIVRDGKIAALYVFLDAPPALSDWLVYFIHRTRSSIVTLAKGQYDHFRNRRQHTPGPVFRKAGTVDSSSAE